jgi:hypothetical protein
MERKKAVLLFLLFLAEQICGEKCEKIKQVKFNSTSVTLYSNDSMEVKGQLYTNGTFWQQDNDTIIGCPCMIHKCIKHCSSKNLIYLHGEFLIQKFKLFGKDVKNLTKYSLEQVQAVLLSSHHHASENDTNQNKSRKIFSIGEWGIHDVFQDYYVIEERFSEFRSYRGVKLKKSNQDEIIEKYCFLIYNGVNISNCYFNIWFNVH